MLSLPTDTLLDLAPLELPNYRQERYRGDDCFSPLTDLTAEDQERIHFLYAYLHRLMSVLAPHLAEDVAVRLRQFHQAYPLDPLVQVCQALGPSSYAARPSSRLAKTLHDVRGGALTSLLGYLQISVRRELRHTTANALYFLTHDQLKIMRSALTGLDDEKRNADLQPIVHTTDLLVQKWQRTDLDNPDHQLRVQVHCHEGSAISECCVEFAAIDRVLYNYMNNASRHAVGDEVDLILLPVPDAEGDTLRIILSNVASPEDVERLRSGPLESLFQERVSTTGSGYGLAIAAEFVSHAFGVATAAEAVRRGYLGARLVGDKFLAWFHWPKVCTA